MFPTGESSLGVLKVDPLLNNYAAEIQGRVDQYHDTLGKINSHFGGLKLFADSYKTYGLHTTATGVDYREWAPQAQELSIYGDFSKPPVFLD